MRPTLSLLLVGALASVAAAQTNVSGPVSTNTTWTKANQPYHVTDTITVPTGNTLTIEPGVDVLFDADVQFIVQGSLHAVGTETDGIRFMKGTVAEWRGIRISGGDSSAFAYTRISDGNARGNWPDGAGGGLFASSSTLTLTNCTITGNSASAGGGLHVSSSTVTLTNCTITGNSAVYGGGVQNYNNSALTMTNCTISGNWGSDAGGGVLNDLYTTLTLTNCTISGNSTSGYYGQGGGVYNGGNATLTLTNCTISGNSAYQGGGVWNYEVNATLTMANAIVWGNSASYYGGTIAVRYSDIEGGYTGTGNINADPLFVNAAAGDYHLQAGSPCIGTGEGGVDMGAFPFEEQPGTPVCGEILTQTWTAAGSPYRVTCAVTVPSANTLTIEPGVDVLFDADVQFIVQGSLHAVGTETDSIRFIKGTASEWGGIRISGGDSSTIAYARISDANNDGPTSIPERWGGAMCVAGRQSRVAVTHAVLRGNRAVYGGGLFCYDSASVSLRDCAVSRNSAGAGGGGLHNEAGLVLVNCAITDNQAGLWGGGLTTWRTGTILRNCTVAGNTASALGSGLYFVGPGTSTLVNVIVWDNAGSQQVGLESGEPATVAATYSDIQGGYPGMGNINADPLFVNAAAGDYHLQTGSPCIGTGEGGVDMGAFPFQVPPPDWHITADTTWATDQRINRKVIVDPAVTLTILPGVDVLFDADVQFIVQGALHAVGTETDSIRFVKGTAAEWGGIRISGGDSSTIAYARISGGNAHAPGVTGYEHYGGGIYLSDLHTLGLINAVISGNTAVDGGGLLAMTGSRVSLTKCVVDRNTASDIAGGIYVHADVQGGSAATLSNCTLTGNVAPSASGGVESANSTVWISNCILWGNAPVQIRDGGGSTITATYSDIQGGYAGTGNINADPVFVNAAAGDYHLQTGSPCINTGDPASPLDPDGTRADMGAFPFQVPPPSEDRLALGKVRRPPGTEVIVPVVATLDRAYNVDMAFVADTSFVRPDSNFVRWDAFEGDSAAWNAIGDTIFITFASATPITMQDGELARLAFRVKDTAPLNTTVPLVWLPEFTNVNEQTPLVADGSITVGYEYGDVSHDGEVAAFDASLILRYVVRIRPDIDVPLADVTANGKVTGYDAAHVLYKVLHPAYVFPVEGGTGLTKPALGAPLAFRWERDGSGWGLRADYAGMLAGELTLALPSDAAVTVSGGDQAAYRQDGATLRVAFVRLEGDEPILLRFAGEALTDAPPRILSAALNEGQVAYTIARPVEFSLDQNVPNPFNPQTSIRFGLPEAGQVRLAVYDVNGRFVRTLVDGTVEAGTHDAVWDGRDALGREVSSGVYIYRLTYAGRTPREQRTIVRRMVLVR